MPSFTEKEWKSKRMSEAEGSGVAGAIKAFNAAWPAKLSEVDAKSMIAAGNAIETFQTALTKAKGKCEAAKKPDPKKLKTTLDLIETWQTDLRNCQLTLNAAQEKKQGQVAIDIVVDRVHKLFADGLGNDMKNSGTEIKKLETAIKSGDIREAYKLQTNISKLLRTARQQLTMKAVEEKLGYAMRDLHAKDDTIKAKSCVPKEFPAWKKALATLNTQLEQAESQLDEAEQTVQAPDPEASGGSPEYKKNLKVAIADYSGVLDVCELTLKNATRMAGQAKRLESILPTLPPEKLPAAQDVVKKLALELDHAEENMKTEVMKFVRPAANS